ncbi:MAG: UDP-N-acetylglucosamine 2-epimerase (non-hydrolyzing) [Deltaproteobacteria bacterium]|nr:UDP-N-acetylglucosamine 2-epimerase (non-hydrolyzing) [Deltaproteobacteria bacterium]
MKTLLVAGARPNFIKIAPIVRALRAEYREECSKDLSWQIVHTGQHYDYEMSQAFFDELEIPKPDHFLEAGSGSHAVQTAKIMTAFEKVCLDEMPDIVIVVGDVNSTLACSIVAKKLMIDVAHVEAGLRSFDITMPEEINRIVTDSISDYLFVTEKSAIENLLREGRPESIIHFVGHVMIDNLLYQNEKLEREDLSRFSTYKLKQELEEYVFLTLHRPSNVDSRKTLSGIAGALNELSIETPILFTVHPRTNKMLDAFDIKLNERIILLPPLGFRESLFLWKDAVMVMTDSGGLQEETTALGVPCLTLRENTERPITVEIGTNTLAGNKKEDILRFYRDTINNGKQGTIPPKWDGKAAERIVDILAESGERIGHSA